ncbi:MAG: alpha-L-rhamnosidase C-terminal domain-containing protein [Verrucomicrobiota bacterium]
MTTFLARPLLAAGGRGMNLGWCGLVWLGLSFPLDAANAPTGLLCDLLEDPELTVITTATPQFGWIYNPSLRNDIQSGYRIIVASSQTLANEGQGDLWDTGWVGSSASINVPYAGAALRTSTDYYWSVQTQDSAGQISPLSAVQHFRTDTQFTTGPNLIYNVSTNTWANRYPIGFVSAAPALLTNTAPGRWFADFGQDAFGYATVHLNGLFNGSNVQARFGEMANGTAVNPSPPSGSTVRYGTSALTLQNGDVVYSVRPPSYSGQTISPPASYGVVMPFRYFELSNCPPGAVLTAGDVTQQRLLYQFNTNAAAFSSSSAALNRVWNLCRNSMQVLGFDGVYVDGDRERTPYEADSYIHQLSSYAVDREFTMARYSFEYLLSHPTWPTEWKFHMIFIAWADYLQTGNTDLLGAHYAALQPDAFTWAATGNGLMKGFPNYPQTTNSDIVDWPAGDRDGFVITSGSYLNWTNSVNNAFYYRALQTMANIAAVLGRGSDAATYSAAAAQVYSAYNTTFWTNSSQSYVDGAGTTHSAAHANFFPLAFGLVPATNQAAALNYIHGRIAANGGMPPSVYGAQYLLEALFGQGDADTALGLLATNGPRGWLNMLNLGSTLTTEAWNFTDKPNMDWNHAWGAAAGNLIQRFVIGVRPITAGYSQFLIQPQLGQTLSFVQGVVPTIRGPVSIQASNGPGLFQLLATLPGNTAAIVLLPAQGATSPAALLDGGVASAVLSNNWLIVSNVGSGQHALWLNTNNTPSQSTLYSNWAAAWFGTNAANPAIAGMAADPDGDGQSNYSEFIAGTDPTNPQSKFQIGGVIQSNALSVSLSGVAGRAYALQRTASLAAAVWSGVATNGPLAASQTIVLTDPHTPSPGAFYRVAVSLP